MPHCVTVLDAGPGPAAEPPAHADEPVAAGAATRGASPAGPAELAGHTDALPARAGAPKTRTEAAGRTDREAALAAAPAHRAPLDSRDAAGQRVPPGDAEDGAPSGSGRRWLRRLRGAVAVALPTAVAAAHASLYGRWEVDDAGITFAYARSVATGAGPVLQPGARPSPRSGRRRT